MNQKIQKLLSAMLAVVMVVQTAIPTVFAAEGTGMIAKTIMGFEALAQTEYTLPVDADQDTIDQVLTFPDAIGANVEYMDTEENTVSEQVEFSVTWESDKELTTAKADTFTYTAVLSDTDKGEYDLANGVSLPKITVTVAETTLMSLAVTPPTLGDNQIGTNGTPIFIVEGEDSTVDSVKTAVYYMNGSTKTYVNPSGAAGDDLSTYKIYAGTGDYGFTNSITMEGGEVAEIFGSGDSFRTVGTAYITLSGGKVAQIQGGDYDEAYVNSVFITMTGGTVTGEFRGGKYGVNKAHIIVTGGTVENKVVYGRFFGGTGIATGYITIAGVEGRVFDNLLYKTEEGNYVAEGDAIIPEGENLTIDSGETLTIDEGHTLTVEKGATITNNGTIQANGTLNYGAPTYGEIKGSGDVSIVSTAAFKALDKDGNEITEAQYGDTITLQVQAEMVNKSTFSLQRMANPDTAKFYLDSNDEKSLLGEANVRYDNATKIATAELDITLKTTDTVDWDIPEDATEKEVSFDVDFGGSTAGYLMASNASGTIKVIKGDGPKITVTGTPKFGEELTATYTTPDDSGSETNLVWLYNLENETSLHSEKNPLTLTADAVGKTIYAVMVWTKNYQTSYSEPIVVGKADGPAAPGFAAMDDTKGADTFSFTTVEGFTDVTAYEYSMDGGNTWTDVSENIISVGNVAGTIQVRIKETDTHEAGESYVHNVPFTASIEGSVVLDKTSNIEYGDILNATASGTQSGADLHYQWKADTENIGTDSASLSVPGSAVGKKITVEVTATGYSAELISSATDTISKKAVTATASTVSKEYDGTDKATVILSIDKVNQEDDITVTAPNARYNTSSTGTDKAVTLGDLTLSGTAADWYVVSAPTGVVGTITAKDLTGTAVAVDGSYTYSGTEIVPTADNVTVKDGDTTLVNGTDYDYSGSNNINVGTATVVVTFKGNYYGTTSGSFAIMPKEITPSIEMISDQSFTGAQLMPLPVVKDNSTTLSKDTDYTVTYGENINAGENAGSVTVTLKGNYTGTESASFNISKAAAPTVAAPANLPMVKGQERAYSFNLSTLAMPQNAGEVTYTVGVPANVELFSVNPTVDGNMLNFTSANVNTVDTITTAVVTITSDNYENTRVTLIFKITDKVPVAISGVNVASKTYNGVAVAYTGTPIAKEGENSVTVSGYDYAWSKVDGTLLTEAPKNAGDYKLTVFVQDTDSTYMGSLDIPFSINKATVTIEADHKSAYVGEAQPALTYTTKGVATGEALQTEPTVAYRVEPDMAVVGQYEIIASGAEVPDTDNYNSDIIYIVGTLTVSTKPSSGGGGGGGGSSSNATVITPPVTTENPNPITEVTITVKPSVSNGTATVEVTETVVNNAIAKAQAEAKKNGRTENGISITIKADTGSATNLTATLPNAVVDAMVKADVKEVSITSGVINIGINLDTMKEIQKQAGSDVVVSATKVSNSVLSTEAKAVIGNRPVYDLSITDKNGVKITDFGSGEVSVSIPYTLGANEKAGNVIAYYIDGMGKVEEMTKSVYNLETKQLSFATNHFSMYGVGYKADETSTSAFSDIASHWAKESIEFVAARGILAGVGDNKFSPDTSMTRGMFVTALGRLAEADVSAFTTSSFADVKDGSYYLGFIEWASKNGIVNGTGNGAFAPDQSISREQMAVIMLNYAKAIGFELPTTQAENAFADNDKISGYAIDAVKIMQMAGILAGKDGNEFDPQGTATRAEVSAVLKRFVGLLDSAETE